MASTHGTLSTALTGNNNDIDFTARFPDVSSKRIKIEYLDPGEETAEEEVTVTFDPATKIILISVTLRSVSSVLSTGDEVKAALDANLDVQKLITYADKAANDGSGVVIAMAATALSAGAADATTKGYDDLDELEDDGWDPISTDPDTAVLTYDGGTITVAADTANGLLEAAWYWKSQFLAKGGNPLLLAGSGTVD